MPCKLVFCTAIEELCKKTESMVCAALSYTEFSLDRATYMVHDPETVEHQPSAQSLCNNECSANAAAVNNMQEANMEHRLSISQPCVSSVRMQHNSGSSYLLPTKKAAEEI